MADLKITIYNMLAHDSSTRSMGAPQTPPLAEWSLEVGYDSIQSKPFPQNACFICIKSETRCALAFGENPVADPELHTVDAGERLYYGVSPGHKLAVIAA